MAKVVLSPLITGITGSIGNITFTRTPSGNIVFMKPYSSPKLADTRRRFLELYRSALAFARLPNRPEFDFILMQLQLYPRYVLYPSNLIKSAQFFEAQIVFNYLLIDETYYVSDIFTGLPDPIDVLSISRISDTLIVSFNRSLSIYGEYLLFFASKRYASAKPYLSAYTSFLGYIKNGEDYIDITEAYINRFGILPAAGEYICYTLTLGSLESIHVSPDVTAFIQVT